MNAASFAPEQSAPSSMTTTSFDGRVVSADEFRRLLVSHRTLVRADDRVRLLRGLRDAETGEVFYVDERKLFEIRR